MKTTLENLVDKHNSTQPRGAGIRLIIQTTKGNNYLLYAAYVKGKRVRKALGGISCPVGAPVAIQREAFRNAEEIVKGFGKDHDKMAVDLAKAKPHKATGNTIAIRLDEWIATYSLIKSGNQYMVKNASKHIMEFFGRYTDLSDLKPFQGEDYSRWLKGKPELGGHSVANHVGKARTFFRWCQGREYCVRIPKLVREIPRTDPLTKALTSEELDALRKADCTDHNLKNLFLLGCNCGTRKCDLRRLTFADLGSIVKGVFTVKDIANYTQHKTEDPAEIYLSEESKGYILDQWERSENKLEAPVFTLFRKKQARVWNAWLKTADITRPIKLCYLRHTAATRLRAKGYDARVIQKLIGWKNLSTMDKVYMGEDKARLLEAANGL